MWKNCQYFVLPICRKPQRNQVETEVVCSIPHKVSLLATGSQESTAKHPKKGVCISMDLKNSTMSILICEYLTTVFYNFNTFNSVCERK